MLMCLALSLFAFRRTSSVAMKRLYIASMLLTAVTVPLTLVRSVWIAGGLLFLLEVVGFKRARANLLIAASIFLATIFYASSNPDLPLQSYLTGRGLEIGIAFDQRLELLQTAWHSFLSSPLVGFGFEEARYQGSQAGLTRVASHNTFLTMLCGFGLVGMTPLILAWAAVLINSVRDYFRLSAGHWGREWLFAAWGALLVFFVVASSVDFTIIPVGLMYFYMVMGLLTRTTEICGISPVQEAPA